MRKNGQIWGACAFAILLLVLFLLRPAPGANIALFSGPTCQEPSQTLACLNQIIQAINAQITPASMASGSTPRNLLDNGGMAVQQRGTGIQTCGTTSVPATAYAADRWGCHANVTSGAGRMRVVTTGPTPPAGFVASQILYRTSGALTQPVCAVQELPTNEASTALQGQVVSLSFYAQALAGLSADNGNVINAYIIYGTGTDEGLGTMTASPAVTPAWTGINSAQTQAFTITTGWVRYAMSGQIPATATEVGVMLCFTPTSTGAGTTDGFAFTGVQLEIGSAASPFEFKKLAAELAVAQRYYWQVTETAASVAVAPSGQGASTTTCVLSIPLPVTMRAAPTYASAGTALGATTWTVTHVVTNTVLSTPFLAATTGGSTANMLNLTATTGATLTAGQTCTLTGAAGGSIITASADF